MREIKFRAYSTHLKKYVKIDGRYKSNENGIIIINGGMDVILEQYTGLKDKNGVEIYEGDVVKGKIDRIGNDYKGVVIFWQGKFILDLTPYLDVKWWKKQNENWKPQDHYFDLNNFDESEIIGNIHEGIDSDE